MLFRSHRDQAHAQQRILALEDAIAKHQADRAAVKHQLDTLQAALDEALQQKVLLQDDLSRLRREALAASSRGGGGGDGGSVTGGAAAAAGPSAHDMRLEMERLTRDHSATVTRLNAELAQLRVEHQLVQRTRAQEDAQRAQLEQLQRNNEVLRRDVMRLQQQVASSSGDGHVDALTLETKVQSFERTILQLNEELSVVDDRIARVERQNAEEKQRLIQGFDAERLAAQREREECDALVLKMTNELEFLIRENTALKRRLGDR